MNTTLINDGGPAFPGIEESFAAFDSYNNSYTGLETYRGMTLRDWFAGMALQGDLARGAEQWVEWCNDADEVRLLTYGSTPASDGTNWRCVASPKERLARQCYAYADAMLISRNETTK